MIKKIQFSEDSSLFRNDLTTTQDNQTRRNSYSVPTKRPVIKQIFEFYTKQSYTIGVNATFDRQNMESNDFTLAKFFRFCQDFKIQFLTKKELQEIYIRCSTQKCHMNFQEFEKLISILAYYRGLNLHQFYDELGLSSWQKNLNKMKMFGKPFHMKDDTERFKKDELQYKFELYHPDIKNKDLIQDILQQRKVNQQLMKLQQKEQKEKQKLQFELKFLSGIELMEKYPGKQEIIKQISNKKQKQHVQYYKSIHKDKYSKKPSQQTKFISQPPLVSWKNVENYQIDEKLIESLIEPSDTEDQFLQNYEINNSTTNDKIQLKNSYQEYGKINQKINIRSFSDTKPQKKQPQQESQLSPINKRYYHIQNAKSSLAEEQNIRIHYTERISQPTQINASYTKSPEKLNISIIKRANEIQNQEDLKQKELFDKIFLRKNELQHQKPIYNY